MNAIFKLTYDGIPIKTDWTKALANHYQNLLLLNNSLFNPLA